MLFLWQNASKNPAIDWQKRTFEYNLFVSWMGLVVLKKATCSSAFMVVLVQRAMSSTLTDKPHSLSSSKDKDWLLEGVSVCFKTSHI